MTALWRELRAAAVAESHALRAELRAELTDDRRFPFEPFAAVAFARDEPLLRGDDQRRSVADVCSLVGVSTSTWYDRARNGLHMDEADRWAYAIGLHPWEVWGDLWWGAPTAGLSYPQNGCVRNDPADVGSLASPKPGEAA